MSLSKHERIFIQPTKDFRLIDLALITAQNNSTLTPFDFVLSFTVLPGGLFLDGTDENLLRIPKTAFQHEPQTLFDEIVEPCILPPMRASSRACLVLQATSAAELA